MTTRMTLGMILLASALSFCISHTAFASEKAIKAEYKAGFYYTVKKGDTLWDLSERFADSPWQWPELWHNNRQVTNPHWIYPGQKIRIYQKSWIGSIIPPEPPEPDVVEPSPSEEQHIFYSYPSIDGIGYIKKVPIQPSGIVFKSKEGQDMISKGDTVYVRPLADAEIAPGQRYTVFRTFSGIKEPHKKKDVGTQYYITGILRITNTFDRYAIGIVEQSYRTIHINDQLTRYKKKPSEIPLVASQPDLDGVVIGSEERMSLIGDNTIAFIDKGSKNGVLPGQIYLVYYQDKQRIDPKSREKVRLMAVDFGEVLVLHTEETTSTVLVTQSTKSIYPGARIHANRP